MIRVYDDHILVSIPGLLPEGVTVADLSRDPHGSRLRNPWLAQVFFFTEVVERWGTGNTRMAQACAEQGLPGPEFARIGDEVWVTFRKDSYTDERLVLAGLTSRQIRAVRFVQQNGSISNAEYRAQVSVSARTALLDLTDLVSRDIFVSSGGGGPITRYKIKIASITQKSRKRGRQSRNLKRQGAFSVTGIPPALHVPYHQRDTVGSAIVKIRKAFAWPAPRFT